MAGTLAITREDLRRVDLFEGLSDDELDRWVAVAEVRRVQPGEVIADPDDAERSLQLILEGKIEILLVDGDSVELAQVHEAPTWTGAIAAITESPIGARLQATTDVLLVQIPQAPFMELVLAHRPVHRKIMRQMRPVMSRITAVEQNRERLASLGTMAAGLAHELNNPAAAVRRGADAMSEALDVLASTLGEFVEAGIERTEAQALVAVQREAMARVVGSDALGALDAADAEDELLELLEEAGVDEAWRLTEPLAAAGVDRAWIEHVSALAGPGTSAAIRWVAASLAACGLTAELRESAERMSALVGAVKTYAYMDRGDMVEVDLHEGLESTLTLLGHKLKHTAIEIVRDYDRDLPRLTVRGSELNQVWTNLLDNAIDALGGRGTITVATRREAQCALVEIADDGPGIPPEVLDQIFDPFFTTKAVGSGTGLGLDTARRIVADRHRGSLVVESAPGRTAFQVRLPLHPPAVTAGPVGENP